MFSTLVLSLPSMLNVACLTLLVFFIFAVLGVELFGKVVEQPDGNITPRANFHNLGQALLLLIRCATGCKPPLVCIPAPVVKVMKSCGQHNCPIPTLWAGALGAQVPQPGPGAAAAHTLRQMCAKLSWCASSLRERCGAYMPNSPQFGRADLVAMQVRWS